MKTAIEWLLEEQFKLNMDNNLTKRQYLCKRKNIENKAKELEKNQIINARIDGDENYSIVGGMRYNYAEQYYNETYNQNK
jgi:hypothetical protein